LVLSDVEGRHPRTPWEPAEVAAVTAALARFAADMTPSPLRDAPSAAAQLAHDFTGWRRLADDPPAELPRWAAGSLPALCAAAHRGLAVLTGDTLVHCDIRADNLLLRPDGAVVIVDWPWACTGPPWLDTLLLGVNVQVCDGDGEPVLAGLTGVDAGTLTDVLAGFTGFFVDAGRQPSVPGLPTVRAFQRAQGEALLPWLHRRSSPRGT
jgi:aminoglycoside phosphotransferase (APT) family kinase protein